MGAKLSDTGLLLLLCLTVTTAVLIQGFTTLDLSILHILQISVLLVCLLQCYQSGIRYQRLFTGLLGGLILYLAISSLINPVAYNGLTGFFHFFSPVIWYFISVNFLHHRKYRDTLVATILILALTTACYALYQVYILQVSPTAFFVQQNSCAAFLNIAIFFSIDAFYKASDRSRRQKATQTVLLMLLFFALFTIAGRGALIGSLAGLSIVFIALWRNKQRPMLYRLVLFISIPFLLAGILNQWTVGDRFSSLRQEILRIDSPVDEGETPSFRRDPVSERLLIWKAGLEMLADTPWYGSGFGSFHMRYPAYQSLLDTSSGQYAHNDYLQFLIEFGWPGSVLLGVTILYVISRMIRCIKYPFDEYTGPESVAMLSAMIAVSVHSLVSYNFFILPVLILFSVCLGQFMRTGGGGEISTLAISGYVSKRMYAIICGCLLLVPIMLFSFNLLMNRAYEQGRGLYASNRVIESERYFIRAQNWSDNENIRIARSLVYLSAARAMTDKDNDDYRNLMKEGILHLEEAEQMNPWQSRINYIRGLYLLEFGNALSEQPVALAKQEFVISLKKNKRHFEARLALARVLIESGEPAAGYRILEQGLIYPLPKSPEIGEYLQYLVQQRRINGHVREAEQLARHLEYLRSVWADRTVQSDL